MRIKNMKIYNEYKEIEISEIKGSKINLTDRSILGKLYRCREVIRKEGIKRPFEVVKYKDEYKILGDQIKLLATKMEGYKAVPCLVRNQEQEILLRRMKKILNLEGERNYGINLY